MASHRRAARGAAACRAEPGPIRGCCSGSRCGTTRGGRSCWSRGCSASTCPPTRGSSTRPGCCSARWSPTHSPDGRRARCRSTCCTPRCGARPAPRGRCTSRRGRRSRPTRSTPSCSGSPRRPRRSGTASRRPSAARTTCTPRGVRWRASPPRARSSRSTPTTPSTCSCRPTRGSWPGRARWCWSTTSSPPAAPRSTRSRRCTRRSARALRAGHAGRPPRGRARRLPDGVRVDVVALTRACLTLPPDLAERAVALRAELAGATAAARPAAAGAPHHPAVSAPPLRSSPARPTRASMPSAHTQPEQARPPGCSSSDLGWPAGLPAGARHGFTAAHHRLLAVALPELAADLARAADVRAASARWCSAPRS